MNQFWQTLAAVFLGGLLAGAGGFITSWWTARQERRRGRYQERKAAVEHIWTAVGSPSPADVLYLMVDEGHRLSHIGKIKLAESKAAIEGMPVYILDALRGLEKAISGIPEHEQIWDASREVGRAQGVLEVRIATYLSEALGEHLDNDLDTFREKCHQEAEERFQRLLAEGTAQYGKPKWQDIGAPRRSASPVLC